jgi:hypothetical protein
MNYSSSLTKIRGGKRIRLGPAYEDLHLWNDVGMGEAHTVAIDGSHPAAGRQLTGRQDGIFQTGLDGASFADAAASGCSCIQTL